MDDLCGEMWTGRAPDSLSLPLAASSRAKGEEGEAEEERVNSVAWKDAVLGSGSRNMCCVIYVLNGVV